MKSQLSEHQKQGNFNCSLEQLDSHSSLLPSQNLINAAYCLLFLQLFQIDQMSHYHQEISAKQSHISADVRVGGQLFESDALKRKNLIFAIIMTIIQIAFCFLYGFLFYTPAQLINVTSIITVIAFAILIVAGFGLVFGYTKRLAWSGIGFNLFITAFCLEFYPLINDFWTKTGIQRDNVQLDFSYSNRYYNLYLSNRETTPAGTPTAYGNCIANAMKAALSMAVAFSSVLGRAGQLECLIINIIGVIGFELNRQIIQERIGSDSFGTFFVFTYGGFMGLVLGLFCYLRERKPEYTIKEQSLRKYNGEEQTVLFSLLGALFIFTLFPFLAYEIDAYIFQNKFSTYVSPLMVILAMGAGVIGSLCSSLLFNGYLIARDGTHGLIAGAIAVGSGSLYIVNPTYALITGFIGGAIQGIIQNSLERYGITRGYIFSTVSWSLFAIQGFIGGCFSAGWKRLANDKYSYTFSSTGSVLKNYGEQYQFYAMLVSAGMGIGFGILAGATIYLTNFQYSQQYFDDGYYWRNADCIRPLIRGSIPQSPVPQPEKASVKSESVFLEFQQGNEDDINNRHAYL